jgi:hypothetical protein
LTAIGPCTIAKTVPLPVNVPTHAQQVEYSVHRKVFQLPRLGDNTSSQATTQMQAGMPTAKRGSTTMKFSVGEEAPLNPETATAFGQASSTKYPSYLAPGGSKEHQNQQASRVKQLDGSPKRSFP